MNREALIALRATREAIHIARDVAYPPIAAGPQVVSAEWVREQEELQWQQEQLAIEGALEMQARLDALPPPIVEAGLQQRRNSVSWPIILLFWGPIILCLLVLFARHIFG